MNVYYVASNRVKTDKFVINCAPDVGIAELISPTARDL